jgi:hypothetical protein
MRAELLPRSDIMRDYTRYGVFGSRQLYDGKLELPRDRIEHVKRQQVQRSHGQDHRLYCATLALTLQTPNRGIGAASAPAMAAQLGHFTPSPDLTWSRSHSDHRRRDPRRCHRRCRRQSFRTGRSMLPGGPCCLRLRRTLRLRVGCPAAVPRKNCESQSPLFAFPCSKASGVNVAIHRVRFRSRHALPRYVGCHRARASQTGQRQTVCCREINSSARM